MIYHEIVHTCSNSYVADAAVLSIGGDIARAVADDAHRHAMSRGAYAAKLVRDFAREAKGDDEMSVTAAARRSDQPILGGLRYILERGMHPEPMRGWAS